jgi:hypothetical protein
LYATARFPVDLIRLVLFNAIDAQEIRNATNSHEQMGISGHKTLAMVELYTAEADRKKLAASGMKKKIGGQTENDDCVKPEDTVRKIEG